MPRGRPFKCPYCDSTNTVSKGVRKTKAIGIRKLRLCKSCDRKFTPRKQKLIEE
jgi:transcription elongation factor Elf1